MTNGRYMTKSTANMARLRVLVTRTSLAADAADAVAAVAVNVAKPSQLENAERPSPLRRIRANPTRQPGVLPKTSRSAIRLTHLLMTMKTPLTMATNLTRATARFLPGKKPSA